MRRMRRVQVRCTDLQEELSFRRSLCQFVGEGQQGGAAFVHIFILLQRQQTNSHQRGPTLCWSSVFTGGFQIILTDVSEMSRILSC